MLEKLSNVLKKTTDKIANAVFLDENLVDSIVRDLQRALIEADVNVSLVREISGKIKKDALDERLKGVEKREHIIKLLHDELIRILGSKREIVLGKNNTFLFVGLYGSGKSTTIWKTWGIPPANSPSLRCWAISHSATTLKRRRSPLPGK